MVAARDCLNKLIVDRRRNPPSVYIVTKVHKSKLSGYDIWNKSENFVNCSLSQLVGSARRDAVLGPPPRPGDMIDSPEFGKVEILEPDDPEVLILAFRNADQASSQS